MSSVAPSPSTRGREIARLFRKTNGLLATRAPDLDAILQAADIEVAESEREEPGYAAVLIRLAEGGAGIMLAADQHPGRRRFSIAHELGHLWIPTHATQGPMLRCADADLRVRAADAKNLEWEANDFAAELLMPRQLFFADAKGRPISFATVAHLADDSMYRVSRTAAAWRLVQITREPCALVSTVSGKIQWVARSDTFRHWIPERGQPVGAGTVAAAVRRGEPLPDGHEEVAAHEWLDGESLNRFSVFESAHSIPSQDQVVSLVWIHEHEADNGED